MQMYTSLSCWALIEVDVCLYDCPVLAAPGISRCTFTSYFSQSWRIANSREKFFCLVVYWVWWEACRYCRWGDWGHLKEHVSIFAMIPSIEDNNLQKLFYANKYDAVCIILAFQIATSVWRSPPVKTWSWSWFPYSSWRLSHVPSFLRLPLWHFLYVFVHFLWFFSFLLYSCCFCVIFLPSFQQYIWTKCSKSSRQAFSPPGDYGKKCSKLYWQAFSPPPPFGYCP